MDVIDAFSIPALFAVLPVRQKPKIAASGVQLLLTVMNVSGSAVPPDAGVSPGRC